MAATVSLEEPRSLIHELLPKFKSHADIAMIHSIHAKISGFQATRQKILDTSKETLHCKNTCIVPLKL
jgi:hypothetical protein